MFVIASLFNFDVIVNLFALFFLLIFCTCLRLVLHQYIHDMAIFFVLHDDVLADLNALFTIDFVLHLLFGAIEYFMELCRVI